MELPDEVVSPPGRTADSLAKQAARSLANQLIQTTLPAITKYWEGNIKPKENVKSPRKKFPSKRTLIKHLQSVQEWYQNNESLAAHGSYLRQLVSVACAEALLLLVAKDDCELLFLLTLQLMFCQEAGFFSQSRKFYDARVSRSYAEFLQFFVPFEIESLYTTCINFQNQMPIVILIKNSPYLKDIHLYKNLSDHVLTQLRKHCPDIETITLSGHNVVSEQYLFRTFFSGMDKEQVVQLIDEKDQMKVTFPKLKRLNMLMDLHCDDVMFYIQHYYTDIKTTWTKCVAENRLSPLLLSSLIGPPYCLKGKGDFYLDILELTIRKNTLERWTFQEPPVFFPIVKHVSIFHSFHGVEPQELGAKIKDIVERLRCTSFSHSAPPVEDLDTLTVCVPTLETFGAPFSEMHLSTFEVVDAKILFQCLNLCPNLKVFSVNASRIEMNSDCPFKALNTLTKLNALGMSVKSMDRCDVSCLTYLINAAPNLRTIELFGANLQNVVHDLALSGVLSKIKIISLHKSISWFTEEDLEYCISLGKNMASLSVMMLNPILKQTLYQIKNYFANTQLKVIHRYKMLIS
ncbi:uncharacterized protein LOC135109079 [Scylla paramamosain]|uniref:uncharacterized protein LOC135109079 n=1 Tax=Scylla paramamosain TaxID=85552 RepID=UPI003082C371